MSRRSLEVYMKAFQEGPKGGRVEMKFFGENVDDFSREELLATVHFLAEEVARLQEEASKYRRGRLGL